MKLRFKGAMSLSALSLFTLFSACTSDYIDLANLPSTSDSTRYNIPVTKVYADGSRAEAGFTNNPATRAIASLPDGLAYDDEPTTRAGVNQGADFFPATEGSDFTAHAYFLKIDGNENNNEKRIIAYAPITWDRKGKAADGKTIALEMDAETLNFHWINGTAADLKPGDKWKMCSIIGGQVNTAPITRRNGADRDVVAPPYAYVDFSPSTSGNINHSTNVDLMNIMTIPYVADWIDVTITANNRIHFEGLAHKAVGVMLNVNVKRDENLVPASEHRYSFRSSALSPNGGIAMFDYVDPDRLYTTKVDVTKSVSTSNWNWDWEADRYTQTLDPSSITLEYRYLYDSRNYTAVRQQRGTPDNDQFYIWGMPINTQILNETNKQIDNQIARLTKITPYKGGYMLGMERNIYLGGTLAGTRHGDEWLFGDGDLLTNEWRTFSFAQNQGQIFRVNLSVMRPQDLNAQYKWRIPLERIAKSYATTTSDGLINNVDPNYEGGFENTVDGSELVGNNTKWYPLPSGDHWNVIPSNYNIPYAEEATALIPYIDGRQGESFGFENTGINNIDGRAGEWVLFDETNHNSYNTNIGRDRPAQGNRLLSQFKQDKSKNVIYGLRFVYDWRENGIGYKQDAADGKYKPDNAAAENNLKRTGVGSRYACAYRWKLYTDGVDGSKWGDGSQGNDDRMDRIYIQARWIGNADVSLDDIANEAFWAQESTEAFRNDPYKNLTVTRILPAMGSTWLSANMNRNGINFRSYTPLPAGSKDQTYQTWYTFQFSAAGFGRGYNYRSKEKYPVVVAYKWDLSEDAADSPRNQKLQFSDRILQRHAKARNAQAQGITPEEFYR